MYNSGKVLGATTTTTGAVVLPHTSGNTLGTILAYAAITIGVAALMSQVVVRVVKRHYR